mmetsp:Transcript_27479/g.69945  ORF Transcript_27479/g.69945 Transcript_27479/m.69945 type:complete len:261 (-) Transcript_27479:377-1159(-)
MLAAAANAAANAGTDLALPILPVAPPPTAPPRLEHTIVPLAWTSEKVGPQVNVSGDGTIASRSASGHGAQCASVWFPASRDPHIFTIALALDEVLPSTMIGIVGRNYWPSDWVEPLSKVTHAIALECGTGRFSVKGKATSFVLKPLASGSRLNLIVDMQTQELTVELLGEKPGTVASSCTIENIPAEVTLAVGFSAGGPQSVRLVGCSSEKPEMKLLGKLRKDLWDEDNKVEPLALNVKREPTILQQQENIAKMAASLDM